jgi:indolepyruvate ferredoxin oxidoreductase beta subunit
VTGYLLLRLLAGLRRFRPRSLRYVEEHRWLGQWQAAVIEAAARDTALAVELAECQSLVRGYGETLERGHRRLQQVLALRSRGAAYQAATVRALREAAERDADGDGFERMLATVAG